MSRGVTTFNGSRSCAALLMPQYQNQFCVEVFHCIFDAAQPVVIGDVARYADNEQVTQSLIKDKFGSDPRVGATEDYGEWMLTSFQFLTTGERLVWMLLLVPRITPIPFHKPRKSSIGGYDSPCFLPPSGSTGKNEQQPTAVASYADS